MEIIIVALLAIQIIIVNNYLMEILLDNAYVNKAIMMIIKIVLANSAQNFGKFINEKLFSYFKSTLCSYNSNNNDVICFECLD